MPLSQYSIGCDCELCYYHVFAVERIMNRLQMLVHCVLCPRILHLDIYVNCRPSSCVFLTALLYTLS